MCYMQTVKAQICPCPGILCKCPMGIDRKKASSSFLKKLPGTKDTAGNGIGFKMASTVNLLALSFLLCHIAKSATKFTVDAILTPSTVSSCVFVFPMCLIVSFRNEEDASFDLYIHVRFFTEGCPLLLLPTAPAHCSCFGTKYQKPKDFKRSSHEVPASS